MEIMEEERIKVYQYEIKLQWFKSTEVTLSDIINEQLSNMDKSYNGLSVQLEDEIYHPNKELVENHEFQLSIDQLIKYITLHKIHIQALSLNLPKMNRIDNDTILSLFSQFPNLQYTQLICYHSQEIENCLYQLMNQTIKLPQIYLKVVLKNSFILHIENNSLYWHISDSLQPENQICYQVISYLQQYEGFKNINLEIGNDNKFGKFINGINNIITMNKLIENLTIKLGNRNQINSPEFEGLCYSLKGLNQIKKLNIKIGSSNELIDSNITELLMIVSQLQLEELQIFVDNSSIKNRSQQIVEFPVFQYLKQFNFSIGKMNQFGLGLYKTLSKMLKNSNLQTFNLSLDLLNDCNDQTLAEIFKSLHNHQLEHLTLNLEKQICFNNNAIIELSKNILNWPNLISFDLTLDFQKSLLPIYLEILLNSLGQLNKLKILKLAFGIEVPITSRCIEIINHNLSNQQLTTLCLKVNENIQGVSIHQLLNNLPRGISILNLEFNSLAKDIPLIYSLRPEMMISQIKLKSISLHFDLQNLDLQYCFHSYEEINFFILFIQAQQLLTSINLKISIPDITGQIFYELAQGLLCKQYNYAKIKVDDLINLKIEDNKRSITLKNESLNEINFPNLLIKVVLNNFLTELTIHDKFNRDNLEYDQLTTFNSLIGMEFVEKIIYNENKYEKKITEDMLTLKYKIIELSIVENTDKKIAILKDLFKSVNLSMKIVLSIKVPSPLINWIELAQSMLSMNQIKTLDYVIQFQASVVLTTQRLINLLDFSLHLNIISTLENLLQYNLKNTDILNQAFVHPQANQMEVEDEPQQQPQELNQQQFILTTQKIKKNQRDIERNILRKQRTIVQIRQIQRIFGNNLKDRIAEECVYQLI